METKRDLENIVVIDTSVLLHRIHQSDSVLKELGKEEYKGAVGACLASIASLDWLGELKPKNSQVIWVQDSRPYWRSEYLLDPKLYQNAIEHMKGNPKHKSALRKLKESEAIFYKAGRKFPEYRFTKLKSTALEMIDEAGWNYLRITGYEADDLAAAICKMTEETHRVLLATVDNDWLGLVSPRVSWFCTTGYAPRYRPSLLEVNQWASKRLKKTFKTPRELWDYKADYGDAGDNLPPGSPVEVIDLLNPPPQYCLWNIPSTALKIAESITAPKVVLEPEKISRAESYLTYLGLPKPIRTYQEVFENV